MGFASFLVGALVGGVVVYIWRDELVELWYLLFRGKDDE